MEGHGDMTLGHLFERAARIHILGSSANLTPIFPDAATRLKRRGQIMAPVHIEHSWNYFSRKLDWLTHTRGDAKVFA
jgi:hypothetical protein